VSRRHFKLCPSSCTNTRQRWTTLCLFLRYVGCSVFCSAYTMMDYVVLVSEVRGLLCILFCLHNVFLCFILITTARAFLSGQYLLPTFFYPIHAADTTQLSKRRQCEQNSQLALDDMGAFLPPTRRNSTSLLANLFRLVETVANWLKIPYAPPMQLSSHLGRRCLFVFSGGSGV